MHLLSVEYFLEMGEYQMKVLLLWVGEFSIKGQLCEADIVQGEFVRH
jgi:hypothetical protein